MGGFRVAGRTRTRAQTLSDFMKLTALPPGGRCRGRGLGASHKTAGALQSPFSRV